MFPQFNLLLPHAIMVDKEIVLTILKQHPKIVKTL